MPDKDELTVSQAAQYKGVQPATIRKWINQNRLPARKVGGHFWFVTRADLDTVEIGRAGRPRETKKGED